MILRTQISADPPERDPAERGVNPVENFKLTPDILVPIMGS